MNFSGATLPGMLKFRSIHRPKKDSEAKKFATWSNLQHSNKENVSNSGQKKLAQKTQKVKQQVYE